MMIALQILNVLIPIAFFCYLIFRAVQTFLDYLHHVEDVNRQKEIQGKKGKRFRYTK